MVKLWINSSNRLSIQPAGRTVQMMNSFLNSLPMVEYVGGNEFYTSILHVNFIKYLIEKEFPHEEIITSSLVSSLLEHRKTIKDKIVSSELRSDALSSFSFNLDLYDFQKIGVMFLAGTKRALLCDDVGLGKSITALGAAQFLLQHDNQLLLRRQPVLIVCPAQLKKKWEREVLRSTNESCLVINTNTNKTGSRKRLDQYQKKAVYKIVNYELLLRDADYVNRYIRPIGILIVDEVQYIKSHKARRHHNIFRHSMYSDYFFGLSATPIERGAVELFNLFKLIDLDLFGDRHKFYERYTIQDYWGNVKATKNVDELKLIAYPYILRRHKEEVSEELPSVIENNYYIDLTKQQLKLYKSLRSRMRAILAKHEGELPEDWETKYYEVEAEEADNPLALLHQLRRVCLSASLIDKNLTGSAKLESLLDIIESLGDSKAVVFCFYRDMVELISSYLFSKKIPNLCIHGGMKAKPTDVIQRFTPESKYKVLISTDILKEGHDLLAANYIINFDIPFSATNFLQRCGRVDRIGQVKDTVYFVNMIADNTLELDVYDTIRERMMLSKNIFDPDFVSSRITINDIRNFLKD